jgi:hypothetical protein
VKPKACAVEWCAAEPKAGSTFCAVHVLDQTIRPDVVPDGEVVTDDSELLLPECGECDGDGEVECNECAGSGDCTCPNCDDDHDCGECEGMGYVECQGCNGSGLSEPVSSENEPRYVWMWASVTGSDGKPLTRRHGRHTAKELHWTPDYYHERTVAKQRTA